MADVDKTEDQELHAHAGERVMRKITNIIDFAKENVSANDVVKAINVKKGQRAVGLLFEVMTAEGSAGNADVGDGADADGYLVDVDLNATGVTVMELALTEGAPNTVERYTGGKYYDADDTIDFVPSIDLDTAKVRVTAIVVDYN